LNLPLTDGEVREATAHIKNLADHHPLSVEEVDTVLRGWGAAVTV
jgi:hypothetical protein